MKRLNLLGTAIAGCLMIPVAATSEAADQPEVKKSVELERNGELKEKKTTDLWLGTPVMGVGFRSPCFSCPPSPCQTGNCFSQPFYGQPVYSQPMYDPGFGGFNTPVYQPRYPYGYRQPRYYPPRNFPNYYGNPYGYHGRYGAAEDNGMDRLQPVSNVQDPNLRYQPLGNPGNYPHSRGLENARDNGYMPINQMDAYPAPAPLNRRPLDNPYYR